MKRKQRIQMEIMKRKQTKMMTRRKPNGEEDENDQEPKVQKRKKR